MSNQVCQQLQDLGFAGPVPILSGEQCRQFMAVLKDPRRVAPLDWPKGQAATSRAFYEIATLPKIMQLVEAVLGHDVLLFGACILTQKPNAEHPWHSDIETSGEIGKTLSVWIGLENLDASGLQFVTHSHRFGKTVQELRQAAGVARKEAKTDNVMKWAKAQHPQAELVKPAVKAGEALLFAGQTWHHSDNRGQRLRTSLLLQYATPETPIRMPDANRLDWPFVYRQNPKPACIVVRGGDQQASVNRVVPPPAPAALGKKPRLTDVIEPLQLPLPADEKSGFRFHAMFHGATADVQDMEVHASALVHGQMPHPPHTHREEELLIMLAGEADLILPEVKGPHGDERFPLKPGQLVYYPAWFPHSLKTTSAEPANYLMFKWDSTPTGAQKTLPFGHFDALQPFGEAKDGGEGAKSVRTKKLFEGMTGCLRRLHAHASLLEPGAGYKPHADSYDVAIVVLEGEVEALGQRVGPGGTIFHAAGQAHGIRNPGGKAARYIVFEFHGQPGHGEAFPSNAHLPFAQKITDPQRWKRKIKHVAKRLRGK